MNSKTAKKLRQLHRRTTDENLARLKEEMKGMIKEPPSWFPKRPWFWLQSKFLNV